MLINNFSIEFLFMGLDWRIIFRFLLKKEDRIAGTGFRWLRIRTSGKLL
jgi:hypothetical protein